MALGEWNKDYSQLLDVFDLLCCRVSYVIGHSIVARHTFTWVCVPHSASVDSCSPTIHIYLAFKYIYVVKGLDCPLVNSI